MRVKIIRRIVISCLLLLTTLVPITGVLAETPSGIGFQKTESTEQNTTDSQTNNTVKREPTLPGNTAIKKGGVLPVTGELAQPILYFFIGILLLIFIIAIYFMKKNKEKEVD